MKYSSHHENPSHSVSLDVPRGSVAGAVSCSLSNYQAGQGCMCKPDTRHATNEHITIVQSIACHVGQGSTMSS